MYESLLIKFKISTFLKIKTKSVLQNIFLKPVRNNNNKQLPKLYHKAFKTLLRKLTFFNFLQ